MKIAIVSDAWFPQVNGVVRTLDTTKREVRRLGHRVYMITPDKFVTVPCPTYPEIRLAVDGNWKVAAMLDKMQPDAIHISTEGPLGYAARRWCLRNHFPFTTAYHTNFPEYIELRTGIPEDWLYQVVRRFHEPSAGMMVVTPTVRKQLRQRGFSNLKPWSRGVDVDQFHPDNRIELDMPGPIQMYVGRVAPEKNLEAFLDLDLPGSKVIVGGGPAYEELKYAYPKAHFMGVRQGGELAQFYAAADVFVFPSKTDTFGLVMLEALASGVPVAAYPIQGPLDVIGREGRGVQPGFDKQIGVLGEDLKTSILEAQTLSRTDCRAYAELFSWQKSAQMFVDNLAPIRRSRLKVAAA